MKISTSSFHLSLYTAGDPDADKLAIVCPGKLDTKDYPHMRSLVELLSGKGYFAVALDAPGTWESVDPQKSDEENISLYTISNYLQAIKEIIAYFGNKPTLVVGHSLGGSMAMLAGIHLPEVTHFASIMSYYSFSPETYQVKNLSEWRKQGVHESKRDMPFDSEKFETFLLPFSHHEDRLQYDMSEGLRNCTKPKLFIAGRKDQIVDPVIVKKSFEISAEPKVYKEVDCGHDYRKYPEMIEKVNEIVGEFDSSL